MGDKFTSADVARLKAAIASGHRKVKYADKEVEYQSTGDMLRALEMAEKEAAPRARRKLTSVGYFDGN